jgi:hypothetical protein
VGMFVRLSAPTPMTQIPPKVFANEETIFGI